MMTKSLCPECYKTIDAEITVGDHVWMVKTCPDHGTFTAMVERDPRWFMLCKQFGCTNIYNGLLVDVTGKCNISCKYCYHSNTSGHLPIKDIIDHITYYGDKAPFILTGGEPTLHPNIIKIINESSAIGETWLLTNGIKLTNEKFFDQILKTKLLKNNILNIGLSFHPESNGKDMDFVELCRKKGLILGTSFYVIDSVEQVSDAVKLIKENNDVLCEIRIKAASNVWKEQKANYKIFVSDMLSELSKMGNLELDKRSNNKVSYASVLLDKIPIKLISWYDTKNVDLSDIDCAPWYQAKDGSINNFVTTGLLNEKI